MKIRRKKKSDEQLLADAPATLQLIATAVPRDAWDSLDAAAGSDKPPSFKLKAYTGGAMRINGFYRPVVVDLAGMKVRSKSTPIFRDHDPGKIVGHGEVTINPGDIDVAGLISAENEHSKDVVTSAKKGFPWQASIGADELELEHIREGEKATVNGQVVKGPVLIARKSTLGEVSFVALGADRKTSAKVTAGKESAMTEFEKWLKAMGFDPATLDDKQKASMQAQFDALEASDDDEEDDAPPPPKKKGGKKKVEAGSFESIIETKKKNRTRVAAITEIVARAVETHPERLDEIEALGEAAIEGSTDPKDFELELLRDLRPTGPSNVRAGKDQQLTGSVIEAAVCTALKLKDVEKRFKPEVMEAADKQFKHGIGLQELILIAARENGVHAYSITSNLREVLRAAFAPNALRASGFSSYSLPGVLGNVMNKALVDHFNFVESTWREICAIKSVRNFLQYTSYSMVGANEYEKIGPAGEIAHGELGEESYTNKAETFAKMLAVTRQDIINDDLGALQMIPKRLGRGAALKINDIVWTAFMDNATFFTSARGNYDDGADTIPDITGLTLAETLFMNQTDPDGKPLGVTPRLALTPNALSAKMAALCESTEIRDTTSSTKYPTQNPHAGKFKPIRSSYLSNSAYTGYSALAWYLLADPNDLAVMELAFLNGREEPVVESADADFDRLGIQIRAYHDFGAAKQEYRAGVKMKGEA